MSLLDDNITTACCCRARPWIHNAQHHYLMAKAKRCPSPNIFISIYPRAAPADLTRRGGSLSLKFSSHRTIQVFIIPFRAGDSFSCIASDASSPCV